MGLLVILGYRYSCPLLWNMSLTPPSVWFPAFHWWVSPRWHPRITFTRYSPPTHKGDIQGSPGDLDRTIYCTGKSSTRLEENYGHYWSPVSLLHKQRNINFYVLNPRIAIVPPFAGLRCFPQGRDFKQWTGNDSKALMKVWPLYFWVEQDLQTYLGIPAGSWGICPGWDDTDTSRLSRILLYCSTWSAQHHNHQHTFWRTTKVSNPPRNFCWDWRQKAPFYSTKTTFLSPLRPFNPWLRLS